MPLSNAYKDILEKANFVYNGCETGDDSEEFFRYVKEISWWVMCSDVSLSMEDRINNDPPLFYDENHFLEKACEELNWNPRSKIAEMMFELSKQIASFEGYRSTWVAMISVSYIAKEAYRIGKDAGEGAKYYADNIYR